MKNIEHEHGLSLAVAKPKLKLMMTADTVGEVWTHSVDLAHALAKEGVEILLAAIGPVLEEYQVLEARAVPGLRLEYLKAELEWMSDPWRDVERTRTWLKELEDSFRPEVIHLNQFCYSQTRFRAPTLVVAHSCVFSWFEAVKGERPGEQWNSYQAAVRDGLAAATGVSGIADTLLDRLAEYYGPYRRMLAVRSGRSVNAKATSLKSQTILSAGRVCDEAKNISLLNEIADQLAWPIRVASAADDSENKVRDAMQSVEALGGLRAEEMSEQFREAAIYAAPALYEPFGMDILEAAAAGCALVLANIPPLRNIWEGAALFVSPRHPQCWVNALERLIDDELARDHLGELARIRALSAEFSSMTMAKGYLGLYRRLLAPAVQTAAHKIA